MYIAENVQHYSRCFRIVQFYFITKSIFETRMRSSREREMRSSHVIKYHLQICIPQEYKSHWIKPTTNRFPMRSTTCYTSAGRTPIHAFVEAAKARGQGCHFLTQTYYCIFNLLHFRNWGFGKHFSKNDRKNN